ncbi:Myosin heavy chain-related protein [Quillaja saponaria]|uniref:Myosin heavy chain-related protein n=1 Tax=Quillaja saponaria TaxID=32244 RepID=A0AAD7LJ20_QUISA|nr:Myosin heavy chain-related protein [Quillaja saponaria]
MAFSASLHPNLPTTYSQRHSKLYSLKLNGKHKRIACVPIAKGKIHSLKSIKSVLNNKKSSINDNGAAEPARILLERLFEQTQKLEEQMTRESHLPQDVQLGLNLQVLEADLQAALVSLNKKEDDLQEAERMVLLEHSKMNHAKEELERREREIAAASYKYSILEEELMKANHNMASQSTQIEDLNFQLMERDQEIAASQSALSLKEEELEKMRNDLAKKSEEVSNIDSELKSKAQLLNEANEIVRKQETEIQGLQKAIREKEEQLEVSVTKKKLEEEKLKIAEANLEKQTMEWLVAQEELKKLAEEASKQAVEIDENLGDFRRVKKILNAVRSELISSQKYLASSRQKMEQQEQLYEQQMVELEEHKENIMSYMESLKDAQIEVESERVKLRVAEARNKELERDLSLEKELMKELHDNLKKERFSLQQATQVIYLLREELEQRNTELGETKNLLHVKESELVEVKLEIQNLKSEKASFQLILEEKDLELFNARKKLEEVNQEIADLKMLMNGRERQLLQSANLLKEKDEHVQIMQNELNGTKLKVSEAETVVERILDLTNKLVISVRDEEFTALRPLDQMDNELLHQLLEKPADDFGLQKKYLQTELELTKESLRTKEMEVLAAHRALTIKDGELKITLARLDAKEKELKKMRDEVTDDANDIKKLYALAQERIGEKSLADLATEKLQLEAAQLEVEAATSALHKLAEMSRELLNKASLSVEADNDASIISQNYSDSMTKIIENNEQFTEVKRGVAQISALTDQIVKEAGIVSVD